jgi:hypothetical protein
MQLLNQLVDLNEVLYGDDDVDDDLDYILFSLLASTIPKWRTFELLRWVQLLNRLVDLHEILCGGDAIEDDLGAIFSNPVHSTIPK